MKKPTPAQRKALELAVKNGGVIMEGGLDKDPVRVVVIDRLYTMGYLRCVAPSDVPGQPWAITPAGIEALEAAVKATKMKGSRQKCDV